MTENNTNTNVVVNVHKRGLKGGEKLMGSRTLLTKILPLFLVKRKSTLIKVGKILIKLGRSMKANDVVGKRMIAAALKGVDPVQGEIKKLRKQQAELAAKIAALKKSA